MRKIFLFFLSCTLLVTLVIVFRIPLLEWGVPKYLSYKNFHNISFELQSCSLDRLDIETFAADFDHRQQQYTVLVSQISLQYTLAGLSAKRVDRLSIEQAAITLPVASPPLKKQPSFDPSTIKNAIKGLQAVNIPIKEITINQVFINGTNTARLKNAPIAIRLDTTNDKLQANFLVRLTDQNHISATLQRKQNQTISAVIRHTNGTHTPQTIELTADTTQIEAQATFSIEELSQLLPMEQLQGQAGKVKTAFALQLTQPLQLKLQIQAEKIQLPTYSARKLTLALQATLGTEGRVTLNDTSRLQITQLNNNKIQAQQLDLHIGSTLTPTSDGVKVTFSSPQPWVAEKLNLGRTNISNIRIPPLKELFITKDIISLSPQLAPLTFQEISVAGWHAQKFTLTPGSELPITLQTASETSKITSPPWITTAFTIQKGNQQLTCESIHATLNNAAISNTPDAALSLVAPALLLSSNNITLPVKDITGKLVLKEQYLNATLRMMPSINPGKIKLTVKHGLKTGKGMAQVKTEKPILFSQSIGIAELVQGISFPLTVTSGQLNTTLEASWLKKSPLKAYASVQVTDSAGFVKDNIPFSGLELAHTLDLLPQLRSHKPGKLEIAQIEGAVAVTKLQGAFNISASSNGKFPRVAVQKLGANIMQGRVEADPFVYMPGKDEQAVTIRADGIDLAEVTALFKVKGLQVEGKINGHLPLIINQKKVTINNGELIGSEQGGTIRFRPQGISTQQSQLTTYALKALEEFHFTVLRAPVRYQPDGTLLVDIRLQGVSPPLSTTRPVHLNIHTEQNLLSLLKSLRYSNALTKDLDKQLQKRF